MKYVYPCIMTPIEGGGYSVKFPDIAGATQGKNLIEALEMAEDAAGFMITTAPEEGEEIPQATPIEKLEIPAGSFATLIKIDTAEYRKKMDNDSTGFDALKAELTELKSTLKAQGIKV